MDNPYLPSLEGWIGYKELVVAEKIKETSEITSFVLKCPEGGFLPTFQAGQYLSIKLRKGTFDEIDHDVVRNYSLSSGPNKKTYR